MTESSDAFTLMNKELGSYFKRSEFACKCGCGFDTVDTTLLHVLEYVRGAVRSPIIVTSGCRCLAHNTAIGGSRGSKHMQGRAADIKCPDVLFETLKAKVDHFMEGWGGVGYYPNQGFIHIDTRSGPPARWNG